MPNDRTIIVGAGLAGWRTAQELRDRDFAGPITLVGDEPLLPYDRPPLSKQVLTGRWEPEQTFVATAEDLRRLDCRLILGEPAQRLSPGHVVLAGGEELPFDILVAASGLSARQLPVEGDGDNVFNLRRLEDSVAVRAGLLSCGSVAVVGGGFIGAEVAAAAATLGLRVTIIEALERPWARVLGSGPSADLLQLHEDRGVSVLANAPITRVSSCANGVTIEVADGRRVTADMAVVGVGSTPNTSWLPERYADGLACDGLGRVIGLGPDVYAVGDVARWPGPAGEHVRVEHWTNAAEQAAVMAAAITGTSGRSLPPPYFWSDQYGVKLQMIGWPSEADSVEILAQTSRKRLYAYARQGRLVGVLTWNAPDWLARARPLVAERESVAALEGLSAAWGAGLPC